MKITLEIQDDRLKHFWSLSKRWIMFPSKMKKIYFHNGSKRRLIVVCS